MRRFVLPCVCVLSLACGPGEPDNIDDGETSDSKEGTGDGNGDGDTTGDGDSTGDGDGDTNTGDGDADGETGEQLPEIYEGDYLLALETSLSPYLPLQFIATVSVDDKADFHIQPLSLSQGSTTTPREFVGEPLDHMDVTVTNGQFTLELGTLEVTGEANPVTGSEMVVDAATLFGEFVTDDAMCGNVTGMIIEPLEFDFAGSTFAAIKVEDTSPQGLPVEFPYKCSQVGG